MTKATKKPAVLPPADLRKPGKPGTYRGHAEECAMRLARAIHLSETDDCSISWSAQERAQNFYNEHGIVAAFNEATRLEAIPYESTEVESTEVEVESTEVEVANDYYLPGCMTRTARMQESNAPVRWKVSARVDGRDRSRIVHNWAGARLMFWALNRLDARLVTYELLD